MYAVQWKNRRVWTTAFLDCCQMWNGLNDNGMWNDVTLVSSSRRGMQKLLSITHDFVNERGLRVPHTGEKYTFIQMAAPRGLIKVLGVSITPNGKASFNLDTLEGTLEPWIRKAALKPAQKLAIVRDYLIPALEYKLGVPGVGRRVLEEVDASIRQTVRRFLHLPHTGMNNMFLTMPVKDGGLGLCPLRTQQIARVAVGTNSIMKQCRPDITSHSQHAATPKVPAQFAKKNLCSVWQTAASDMFPRISSGVQQGYPISPLLFNSELFKSFSILFLMADVPELHLVPNCSGIWSNLVVIKRNDHIESCPVDEHLAYKMEKRAVLTKRSAEETKPIPAIYDEEASAASAEPS
ncbi:Retrovirus-related Pol polyprotein from type-1 retrotransposable element, partial [Trichinella patagoniensis]